MKMLKGLSVVALVLLMAGSANAAVTFFFSEVGTIGGGATLANPSIELAAPGETATLYLWATTTERVIGMGMNINSSDAAVVEATASEIYNPISVVVANVITYVRWNSPVNSGTPGDLVSGINAVAVSLPPDSPYQGLTALDPAFSSFDTTGYDPANGSFLVGEVTVQGTAEGTTDIKMAVSDLLIPVDEVFFGAGESTPADGNVSGATSQIADATITVLPEPATLALLGFGAAGLLARKRR